MVSVVVAAAEMVVPVTGGGEGDPWRSSGTKKIYMERSVQPIYLLPTKLMPGIVHALFLLRTSNFFPRLDVLI